MKKGILSVLVCAGFVLGMVLACPAHAADKPIKMAYVDLRKAFYEYEKSKTYDKDLTDVTAKRTEERNKMVEELRKMQDEAQLLNDKAKEAKQKEMEAKAGALNEFDKNIRQELLNKKNDMFKEVIGDIQKVVDDIGKRDKYDYILDSRNIMYASEGYDITDEVLKTLNSASNVKAPAPAAKAPAKK